MCRQQATAVDVLRKPIDGRIGNFQVERGAPWQDAPDVVAIGWRQIEHTFAWYFLPRVYADTGSSMPQFVEDKVGGIWNSSSSREACCVCVAPTVDTRSRSRGRTDH
jgi:hypothetical protein